MGVLFPFYSIIVPGDEMTMMNDDVGSLPLAAHLTTVRTNQDTYLLILHTSSTSQNSD